MNSGGAVVHQQYERSTWATSAIGQVLLRQEGKEAIADVIAPAKSAAEQRRELADWIELVAHMVDPALQAGGDRSGYRRVPGVLVAKLRGEQRVGTDHTAQLIRLAKHLRDDKVDREDLTVLRDLARTTKAEASSAYSKLYDH
jgi:hypothetical protein